MVYSRSSRRRSCRLKNSVIMVLNQIFVKRLLRNIHLLPAIFVRANLE